MKKFVSQNRGVLALAAVFLFMGSEYLWDSISAERYGLAVVFLIGIALLTSLFVFAYRDPEQPPSYLMKLWATPIETTRTGLWMRAGLVVLVCLPFYIIFRYDSWTGDSEITLLFMAVDGMKALLWLPFLYWYFRRQYNLVPSDQFNGSEPLLQKFDCPRQFSRRETLTAAFAMVAALVVLSVIGMWLR